MQFAKAPEAGRSAKQLRDCDDKRLGRAGSGYLEGVSSTASRQAEIQYALGMDGKTSYWRSQRNMLHIPFRIQKPLFSRIPNTNLQAT